MWGWEETEWRVVVKKEDENEANRVERPLPVPKEDVIKAGSSGSKLFKAAAERMMEASGSGGSSSGSRDGSGKPRSGSPVAKRGGGGMSAGTGEDHHADGVGGTYGDAEDIPTDADGWIYGDNKWENRGNKGGMGKVSSIYCPPPRHIAF